jgi:hypothetical protein
MAHVSLPHDAKAGPTKSEVRTVLLSELDLGPTDHFAEVGSCTGGQLVSLYVHIRDLSGALYSAGKAISRPTSLETKEFARLQTVRTAYGLGRIRSRRPSRLRAILSPSTALPHRKGSKSALRHLV